MILELKRLNFKDLRVGVFTLALLFFFMEATMIGDLKEVYFDKYCNTCEHSKLSQDNDICNECLSNPGNYDSNKPIRWKEKEKK